MASATLPPLLQVREVDDREGLERAPLHGKPVSDGRECGIRLRQSGDQSLGVVALVVDLARIILAQGPNLRFEPYDRFRHKQRNAGRSLDSLLGEFAELRGQNLALLRSWNVTDQQLDLPGEQSLEATPLEIGGVLYFTGSFADVYAVSVETGHLLWKHEVRVWEHNAPKMNYIFPLNRGVSLPYCLLPLWILPSRLLVGEEV